MFGPKLDAARLSYLYYMLVKGRVYANWVFVRTDYLRNRKRLPMNRPTCLWTWLCAALFGVVCGPAFAQEDPFAGEATPAPKAAPKAAAKAAAKAVAKEAGEKGPYRNLAPGVMIAIDPAPEEGETFSRHDINEVLAGGRKLPWAQDVAFRHDVFNLEFKFKPVRMMYVDVPQTGGQMQRELIWYVVYSITNTGKTMHPVANEDGTYKIELVDQKVQFIPKFYLEGYPTRDDMNKKKGGMVFPDRVLPVAIAQIRSREDPSRRFLNAGEMCREIAVGETVWGIATWEKVNLGIRWFSIYVEGLTNAYKWVDDPAQFQNPAQAWVGKGRRMSLKTLKLNFWRAADEINPHEEEIRYGMPGGVDYEWVYR